MVTMLEAQGKEIFQWGEKFVDIATLERLIYRTALAFGRDLMKQCMEQADQRLAEQRDRTVYRNKGYRETTLKTVMGEVSYRRHVYLEQQEEGPSRAIYLLDKSMGLDSVGLFSDTVCRMAVEAACAASFRTASTAVNDLTGLALSHVSVWRMVQSAGEWEQRRVDGLADAVRTENSAGSYQTAVLYEEMDGVYLAMQGKDRKEHGPSKEMKVSIAYSGVLEDASGRRRLANKVSFASMEPAKEFKSHAEGVVAEFYAVDSIQRRVFNSDGANWLQRNMVPGCTYQLDPFHRNKAVRTYMSDPDLQTLILGLLNKKKVTQALEVIEASIESTLDPAEQENRRRLFSYFNNHRRALVPYYERAGRKAPAPNEGQKPARMGSMESNIFTIIGNRMKHNRTCWSVAGANNLAALLALHHTGHLRRVLKGWEAHGYPRATQTVLGPISAAKMDDKDGGEGYIPPHTFVASELLERLRYYFNYTPISKMSPF